MDLSFSLPLLPLGSKELKPHTPSLPPPNQSRRGGEGAGRGGAGQGRVSNLMVQRGFLKAGNDVWVPQKKETPEI